MALPSFFYSFNICHLWKFVNASQRVKVFSGNLDYETFNNKLRCWQGILISPDKPGEGFYCKAFPHFWNLPENKFRKSGKLQGNNPQLYNY